MDPGRKFNLALQETRLMAMTAQILFGFQFHAAFQSRFVRFGSGEQRLDLAAQLLLVVTLALLIAPSVQHHVIENGAITPRLFRATKSFAGLALLPFALGIGIDLFLVFALATGLGVAVGVGAGFCLLALAAWFGLGLIWRDERLVKEAEKLSAHDPLPQRITQLLTEARVVLPGVQALFGFQLIAVLMPAFTSLPPAWQAVHLAALAAVAVAMIVLVAPAAVHRLGFGGEESQVFERIATNLILISLLPLSFGIAADVAVAAAKVTGGDNAPVALGVLSWLILALLWFVHPLAKRRQMSLRTKT